MKKRIALLLGLTLGFTAISCSLPPSRAAASETEPTNKVVMFRLYNPNSGEHFYTGDEGEKTDLVDAGWHDEGIGWIAPVISDTPVYRLYNENAGDHHYTLNADEKDFLIGEGWKYEDIGWYSDDEESVPLYREYNPNAVTGTHNYTADKAEHDNLVAAGWKDEGIGWYGIEEKFEPFFQDVEIGDVVTFGAYEQDNDSSNGKEEIEWVVLAKEEDKALLISKYALDNQTYNTSETEVTWETCSLRKWLNETFLSNAFKSAEQKMIQTTTVTADENPESSTSPGNNTTDKVFLLSIPEVDKYFSSDEARKCVPTEYAKAQGAYASESFPVDGKATCWWWLRSPGYYFCSAASVSISGSIFDLGLGYGATTGCDGVRPAMWIDLGSQQDQEPGDGAGSAPDGVLVGDIIKFGAYEQDNDLSNGKEEIEWVVLAKLDGNALVLSKYALDCQPFNNSPTEVTWETCSLRKWLNESFISNAFSKDEQKMIKTTIVAADKNPKYNTSPGNNTTDKVFLLSIKEVNGYFISDEARKCTPTEYAREQGAWTIDSDLLGTNGICWWWLRTPGYDNYWATLVNSVGEAVCYGNGASQADIAVRPAMWINLGS